MTAIKFVNVGLLVLCSASCGVAGVYDYALGFDTELYVYDGEKPVSNADVFITLVASNGRHPNVPVGTTDALGRTADRVGYLFGSSTGRLKEESISVEVSVVVDDVQRHVKQYVLKELNVKNDDYSDYVLHDTIQIKEAEKTTYSSTCNPSSIT